MKMSGQYGKSDDETRGWSQKKKKKISNALAKVWQKWIPDLVP